MSRSTIFRGSSALALLILGLSCGSPPLHIRSSSTGVVIGLETLGEYPTSINKIRLSDRRTGEVLWEVIAAKGEPQLHQIELMRGVNPAELSDASAGTFKTIIPADAATFTLPRDHDFAIEVWGTSGRPARAAFSL